MISSLQTIIISINTTVYSQCHCHYVQLPSQTCIIFVPWFRVQSGTPHFQILLLSGWFLTICVVALILLVAISDRNSEYSQSNEFWLPSIRSQQNSHSFLYISQPFVPTFWWSQPHLLFTNFNFKLCQCKIILRSINSYYVLYFPNLKDKLPNLSRCQWFFIFFIIISLWLTKNVAILV